MMRLVAALMLLCVGPGAHAASSQDVAARINAAERALEQWRLDDAAAIASALQSEFPDVPPVQGVVGAVKFYQGDFEGAVAHLKRAAETGGDPQLLELAERTAAQTRGSVAMDSAHFTVRVPAGKDEVLLPVALRALEAAFDALSVAFDFKPGHKIAVDILHDPKGLASVSSLTVKEIETSGTIALCKYNRLMATSPKALARGYSWLDTLSHELVHLIVSSKSNNNTPVWLHEGLAKFNETRWRGAAGLALEPASEALLATALKKDTLITFEQMHPSMAKLPSQKDAALAFAEVFTVVEMIEREFPQKDGRRTTTVLLETLGAGKSMDDALLASTGMDLERLQLTWKSYLKRRAFHLVPGAQPKALVFVKNARSAGADDEEVLDEAALSEAHGGAGGKQARSYVRLANLLRAKRRTQAAAVEYEKARALLGVRSEVLNNRLAGVYLELGNVERAKNILDATLAAFPDEPQTHVLLARVAWRNQDWAGVLLHDERVLRENPFNPEVWAGIYAAADATHDSARKDEAKGALQRLANVARDGSAFVFRAAEGAPGGLLSIASDPWGRVIIDGNETGLLTPVVDLRVKPGPHRVRVYDPVSGKEHGEGVDVIDGKETRVTLTLLKLDDSARAALVKRETQALAPVLPAPSAPTMPPLHEATAPWEGDDDDEQPEFGPPR